MRDDSGGKIRISFILLTYLANKSLIQVVVLGAAKREVEATELARQRSVGRGGDVGGRRRQGYKPLRLESFANVRLYRFYA